MDHDFNSSEIAVLVRDTFQRKGLGQKLMEVVINMARQKGVHEDMRYTARSRRTTVKCLVFAENSGIQPNGPLME
ncbi:MAG: hypothetical protein H6Q52_1768 [Deltaproteobacteria bacterium]|nr:hypothetical protein [Deltaproteobacteria bacterium]